jgi:hypothetical protein
VYDAAGVMSVTGSLTSTPATGLPGRVGVTRAPPADGIDAPAGASGLNVMADDVDVDEVDVEGALTSGLAASVFEVVSASAGVGFVVELQPGLAKIRMSAKTWMPTTIPKIFRIFIGGFGSVVVKVGKCECYPKLAAGEPRF